MSEAMKIQAALHTLRQRLIEFDDPDNPDHWRRILHKLSDICCLNASKFKDFAADQTQTNLKYHYLGRSQTWLNYAYQASAAIELIDRYSRLSDADRQFVAKQLRRQYGQSFIANAIEYGHMDVNHVTPSELSCAMQPKAVLSKSNHYQSPRKTAATIALIQSSHS